MPDLVLDRFVENARADAAGIARRSEVLEIRTDPRAPTTFFCRYSVPYLQRLAGGTVAVHPGPVFAAVHFPPDYLRSADRHLYMHVAGVMTPDIVHPNIYGPVVCLGSAFRPGTRLALILRELYEIFTYSNYSLVESNALNPEACRLLRAHCHLLDQLHPLPFIRRTTSMRVKVSQ